MKQELKIDINTALTVSDESARRCLLLLEIWMDDNPDATIVCEQLPLLEGGVKHKLTIKRRCYDGKE